MLKWFAVISILLLLLFIPHQEEARQAACTRTIAADLVTIDDWIYAAQTDGRNHDGDVICIAAGTVEVTSLQMLPNHNIELRGAGSFVSPWGSAGQTIFHSTQAGQSTLSVTQATSGHITISNIKWVFDATSPDPGNGSVLVINPQSGGQAVIVHHNDFLSSGSCSYPRLVFVSSHGGVIYRNKFVNVPQSANSCDYVTTNINAIKHSISDSDGSWWASASTLGSADTTGENNLYVEANYFEGFGVSVDRHTSSRIVWRFNEMHSAATSDHGYDSSDGERHGELYNNTFICDIKVQLNSWIAYRGGTGMIFNNIFPPLDVSLCGYPNGGYPATRTSQYRTEQCEEIPGWPGMYSATYPISHQVGWGWINGSNQPIGADTAQGWPGGSGFQQALEPLYYFVNTDTTAGGLLGVSTGYVSTCRAMAYSATGKTSGTTIANAQSAYVNNGQYAFVAFADLVGGSAPTISDSMGLTWTAATGGTNGSMRLSGWSAPITSTGLLTVTLTFDSSSAARAMSLAVMRNLTAVDKNPAVVTDNTSSYLGPSTTTMSQARELVLGYYALNGPTTNSAGTMVSDSVDATYPYFRAVSYGKSAGDTGITGTTGSTAASNVTVAIVTKAVNDTAAEQPELRDTTTDRNGIAGTITFTVNGSTIPPSVLDLQTTDFIQTDREYYLPAVSFNGASGTGSGARASRPMSCTIGVAYWSTDQGSWNTSGAGGQGVLDKCTALNTWTNAWYVPYTYPHPLASVNSSPPPSSAGGVGRMRLKFK